MLARKAIKLTSNALNLNVSIDLFAKVIDKAEMGKSRWIEKVCGIVVVLATVGGAEATAGKQEVQWAFSIDFAVTPDQNAIAWKKSGDGDASIEGGRLRLRSQMGDGISFTLGGAVGDARWDGSKPSALTFRARVVEALKGETAAHVAVRTGDRLFLIPIRDREDRSYHFLFTESGDGRLFIDGEEQSSVLARPIPDEKFTNGVTFGDLGASTGGETEWSDFRWTNEGAFEP